MRAPRSRVSKSSGQGVSRLSYQRGRSLGNHGTSNPPPKTGGKFETEVKSSGREYGKDETGTKFNVSYGDTIEPSDLKDLNSVYRK